MGAKLRQKENKTDNEDNEQYLSANSMDEDNLLEIDYTLNQYTNLSESSEECYNLPNNCNAFAESCLDVIQCYVDEAYGLLEKYESLPPSQKARLIECISQVKNVVRGQDEYIGFMQNLVAHYIIRQ